MSLLLRFVATLVVVLAVRGALSGCSMPAVQPSPDPMRSYFPSIESTWSPPVVASSPARSSR